MIGIYQEKLEDIPVLIVVDSSKEGQPLPVFTYYHGFTSAKEHSLVQAFMLAQKGYRVVLPDSILHGVRDEEINHQELQFKFWEIVDQNLLDIQTIYEALQERQLILQQRFGLGGTSMGGITTAAALTMYPFIKVAAVMMGSPKPVDFAEKMIQDVKKTGIELPITDEQLQELYATLNEVDLSKQIDKLYGRPIFFWHGDADSVVPFEHAYDFYNEAISHYKNPENIRFLREVGQDHKVSRFAMLEFANWVEMHL
ncbi:prolyl oligopeptidase family serine peptidase [Thalassobacillus sp. CUG 92003]|uniref:prolyl oligopeptidase family serine peptidase n=1 Tax=Thalassobacillus sp. CUG 92003 TaxID=2736641 RepID=UPI0015E76C31|nr:prolyl oligopeptidase family serine peptidase [Thalassobacillus sp. CUG 92003]